MGARASAKSGKAFGSVWVDVFHPPGILSLGCCCCAWSQQYIYGRSHVLKILDTIEESTEAFKEDMEMNSKIKTRIRFDMAMLHDRSTTWFDEFSDVEAVKENGGM